jgi:molybdopterin synthase catalytic subunit
MRFRFTRVAIDTAAARREVADPGAGGYVSFEGWVRDHNEGREVTGLEYEAFEALAIKEGERIVAEALARFPIKHAVCVHRVGTLDLTDMAVWVGVSSAHRGEAFEACRFIIDEVKHRVPIWKKEHYRSGDSGWVNCERCAASPNHTQVLGHTDADADADVPDHTDSHAHPHAHADADVLGHVDAHAHAPAHDA